MNKKFVKSQMFNSDSKYVEKSDKFQKFSNPPPAERPRKYNRQYAQKPNSLDLRKYFEIVPASAQPRIRDLIERFPNFFHETSYNYEPLPSRYQGKSQNVISVPVEPEEEECSWDSDGEIDLGVGVIDKAQCKKFEGVAPLKINELKRHERQFLEDYFRRRQADIENEEKQEKQQKQDKQQKQNKQEKQQKQEKQEKQEKAKVLYKQELIYRPEQQTAAKLPPPPKPVPVKSISQSQSDDEIQIAKTIQYEIRDTTPQYQPEQRPSSSRVSSEILVETQSEGSSGRFNDSQDSDDIFGDNEDESNNTESKQSEEEVPKQTNRKGYVQFAKGQFGAFAMSQGFKPDDDVWTFSNGNTVSKKFSSSEMDQNYTAQHQNEYPLIAFDKYPTYVSYGVFSHSPNVELFMPQNNQMNNGYNHAKKRKYSNYHEENKTQRNRVQSTTHAQYRPKKNEFP